MGGRRVGTDAAPYFRILNPTLQGRKFDPTGDYVRRWLPRLARVPTARIHTPWEMTAAEAAAAGVEVGRDYPAPIADHTLARERTLAAYEDARESHRDHGPASRYASGGSA